MLGYRKIFLLVGLLLAAAVLFTGCPGTGKKPATPTRNLVTPQPVKSTPAPKLSLAVVTKDNAPLGCPSCHKKEAANKDYRLSQEVKKIKGHPTVPDNATVKTCTPCHIGTNTVGPPWRKALHKVHIIKGKNYLAKYDHNCINCHKIAADGTVTVKAVSK
ncbi:MAG: hypothetical protein ACYCX4_07875 [Bacillota bacterium]